MTSFSPDHPGYFDSQMWGDVRGRAVTAAGGATNSDELFRVTSPFPNVWRCTAALRVNNAANLGISARLVLLVGLGRSVFPMNIDLAPNITLNFEVPGQSFSAHIETDAPAVDDSFQYGAAIAPLIPYKGIEVIPVDAPHERSWEEVVHEEQQRLGRYIPR